ncbi:MAG TPA: tetratricopeptide repeat protein, partial [Chthoniobacteraceae bacterium]|nr:tetratricopeptide repeat protein [Chthoniobacteraceae bacterium]
MHKQARFIHRWSLVTLATLMMEASWPPVSSSAQPGDENSILLATEATQPAEVEAQFQSARAYLNGKGVEVDPRKAFDLMRSAAERGHADAIGGMGYFYAAGIAVAKDEKTAVEWFRSGAEKGSVRSQYNLGKMLLDGKGTAVDPNTGLHWIQKAADQGLTEAQVEFGDTLFFGRHGQRRDELKAYPYLLKAAEQGNANAQNSVGYMSQNGVGTAANESDAEHWFRLAAVQDHGKAQSNLGRLLNPRSNERAKRLEALKWLISAADQNEVTAMRTLEDLRATLNKDEVKEARA